MKQQIVIGKIVAPHGVRGEFRIMPLTDNPKQYSNMKKLCLADGRTLTVQTIRYHKNMVLAKTAEITNMDEAELLRNQEIVISREDLPPLESGHFYVADIKGFRVESPQGELLGTLKDVIKPGKTDIFVITTTDGKETLVAGIDSNIKAINMAEKKIIAVLPEWVE
jgi:16S rRNA processing protein RimM